jgi:hypothetical protein
LVALEVRPQTLQAPRVPRSNDDRDMEVEADDAAPVAMTLEEGIRHRLEETKGAVFFSDLKAHLDRDGLFIVAGTHSLVECGVAIALDDVDTIQRLIASQELRKPTADERAEWPNEAKRRWISIVVQPFVLVQDLPD